MREEGCKAYGVEGERDGHWILMDYGDLVIHLFYEPVRELYDLEGLWTGAPTVDLK
jgi:ribosome-associated protein